MIINALIGETIGTAILFTVIMMHGAPIPNAAGLLTMTYAFISLTGAHFNPAFSVMQYIRGTITGQKCILYIIAQLTGGLLAVLWLNNTQLYKK